MSPRPAPSYHWGSALFIGVSAFGFIWGFTLVPLSGMASSEIYGPTLAVAMLGCGSLQLGATYGRSVAAAVFSGLGQIAISLAALGIFGSSILASIVWPMAILVAMGAVPVGYGAYWLAWQNWVWAQQLRGVKEPRTLPSTLSVRQMMVAALVAALFCGFASIVHRLVLEPTLQQR